MNIDKALNVVATNRMLAIQTITRDGPTLGEYGLYRSGMDPERFADIFMAQFPRGRGTRKNEVLRNLYAACYTLKLPQSRTYRDRSLLNSKRSRAPLSDQKLLYLAKLLEAGSITDKILPDSDRRTLNSLVSDGLITGYYSSIGGKLMQHWLTDDGMNEASTARDRLARGKISRATTAREKIDQPDDHDYIMAVALIAGHHRNDPRKFIEHARKILETLP